MDFQKILEDYQCKTCIMSVEAYPDGSYGNIRVAAGNAAHAADIEMVTGHPFVPDTPYELSFPKNMNFEDFCYRCAFGHQQLHTYVNLYQMGLWLEMYLLPLRSDKENIGYCLYSYNVAPRAQAENMTDIAPETSAAVLATCVKLRGTTDFLTSLNEVMGDIRAICDATRCCVLQLDDETRSCRILGDAVREGSSFPPMRENLRGRFYEIACTWEETLEGSTCLILKNEQDMQVIEERNPAWYRSLKAAGIESRVLFPLKYNGALLGYIWATNFDLRYTVKIKEVLELTTFFLASEIANYQMVNRLRILSTMDLLTGTRNRNAMNNRVAEFDAPSFTKPKTLTVIFADLNGLKKVNDQEGHDAGDRMLKTAAAVLRQVFVDEEIYRAGGDEFMIIALDLTKEEVEHKMQQLRKIGEDPENVSFSAGYCFEDQKIDIRRCMHLADESMYLEKEQYYQKYPDQRYR